MSDLSLHRITYGQLRNNMLPSVDDRYGMLSFMTEHMKETFLACPGNYDDEKTAIYYVTDGNVVVGRCFQFGTRLKVGDITIEAQTGGSLEVIESYRKEGVGIDLLIATNTTKEYDVKIGSNYSSMVVPMHKKLKNTIFEMPLYTKLNNTKPFIALLGIEGHCLNILTSIGNAFLKIANIGCSLKFSASKKKYHICKETIVPEWTGRMTQMGDYKYMEIHDAKWLQWNLDYNMNGYPQDNQAFYSIYDKKTNEPVGFYMLKERYEPQAGRYKDIIRGTIVEWASADENKLTESDVILMATQSFSRQTSHITTIATTQNTGKKLKRQGFFNHGVLHFGVKDKKKKYGDITNQSLWRLRYGSCNTIIY